jgi:hypothetical protein
MPAQPAAPGYAGASSHAAGPSSRVSPEHEDFQLLQDPYDNSGDTWILRLFFEDYRNSRIAKGTKLKLEAQAMLSSLEGTMSDVVKAEFRARFFG